MSLDFGLRSGRHSGHQSLALGAEQFLVGSRSEGYLIQIVYFSLKGNRLLCNMLIFFLPGTRIVGDGSSSQL